MNEPLPEPENDGGEESEINSGPPALPDELKPILEMMPEESRPRATVLMSRMVSRAYRGPVPHAEEMGRYKDVDPSFPERFVQMAEREQSHRHELDTTDQQNDYNLKKSGQDKAFLALILLIGLVVLLAVMGHITLAGIVASTTIVGVVGMFITGRYLDYKTEVSDDDD